MSQLRRWTSEGGAPKVNPLHTSREGSIQSFTPDVRCACQFFQSDALLPERINPVGSRPNSRTAQRLNRRDHDYEPVGKPINEVLNDEIHATFLKGENKHDDDLSSTTSQERQYLQGLTEIEDDEMIEQKNQELSGNGNVDIHLVESMQREIEDRYFINTPTTTESRTDCEISTSQVDSSALENLPLKRDSRSKFTSNNLENTKQRFRNQTTKLRSQADKLRIKIKNIKRPQFSMPDRPKFERPKFSLPERPKLHFPERLRAKPSGPDKPRFSFPERPKFSFPDKSKFKIPDKAKINFSALRGHKEPRSKDDRSNSIESEPDSKKKIIDFDFRKYPRLFTKTKKEKEVVQISMPIPRADTPTPPEFATVPRIKNKKKYIENSSWDDTNRYNPDEPRQYGKFSLRNIQHINNGNQHFQRSVDEDYPCDPPLERDFENERVMQDFSHTQTFKPHSWITESAQDANTMVITDNDSGSRQSSAQNIVHEQIENGVLNQPHRAGVLEEINKDEFFLRQKGISEENIEVGKYLSQEIRDAFRLPKNALSQMDEPKINADDFMTSDMYFKDSTDKSFADSIDESNIDDHRIMEENDDGYYTFPPVRPKRIKKLKKKLEKSLEFIDDGSTDIFPRVAVDAEMCDSEPAIKLPPRAEPCESTMETNRFGFLQDGLEKLNEYENETEQIKEPPIAPKRSRKGTREHSFAENESNFDVFIKDQWIDTAHVMNDVLIVHRIEHQYVVPEASEEITPEPPIAPIRKRSNTRGSRGSCATSVQDDDRTSRGAESLILDTHPPVVSALSLSERDLIIATRKSPNYAVVEKTTARKKELPPRPPAPMKRQRSSKSLGGSRQFFTVPGHIRDSSPPKRPHRNYSTLGPSRPPRKKSTTSLITLNKLRREESSNDFTQYVEIDDDGSEIQRDLQAGEIINKMKDRPLPPPPIPKRGNKKFKELNDKPDVKEKSDQENTTITSSISLATEQEQKGDKVYETEEVVEIEVSTQTDPLPDDFNFELSDDEPIEDQKIIFPRTVQDSTVIKLEDKEDEEDAKILAKGLQKFRESSRPSSRSGRASTPVGSPKSPTGRISPTAILVERRISSPTRINQEHQVITTASLTVQPIGDISDKRDIDNESFLKMDKNPMYHEIQTNINTNMAPVDMISDIQNNTTSTLAAHICTENDEICERQVIPSTITADTDITKTQKLHVSNLDVANLSVSELQADKILVSEIQGLSLQSSEINANSNKIIVSGLELAPGVIDEIVQKFSQIISEAAPNISSIAQPRKETIDVSTSFNNINKYCEGETQTECEDLAPEGNEDIGKRNREYEEKSPSSKVIQDTEVPLERNASDDYPPQRPPPPFYPYLQEFSIPSSSFYRLHSATMERPFTDFYNGENIPGPPKRRKPRPVQDSSSDEEEYRPPVRKPHHRTVEPSVAELGGQFVRACQTSISRTVRGMLNYIMDHFTGRDGKKDVQMALVIFLVLIAGLIMLGVGDSRTVHHHHWEFFNPPTDPNA